MHIQQLSIHASIAQYLEQQGITQLTDIQERVIPHLLEHVSDVHGQAQTGTGKTLTFLIPLIERLLTSSRSANALVVSPTRELALQIAEVAQPLAQAAGLSVVSVYGGVPIDRQIRELKKGADIIIGTPGRLRDHLTRATLRLSNLTTLVLDEADIMLDMGFREEIEEILSYTPQNREIWLFSATVKEGISYLTRTYMSSPQTFAAHQRATTTELTQQYVCTVPHKYRVKAIARFIEVNNDFYGLIFCQTKLLTQEVADALNRYGYRVGALHGDMSQNQRQTVTDKFRQGKLSILVATDVAARGIDIRDITHVINHSLPEDQESYVHRVGRTGRAGKRGTAITFIDKRDIPSVQRIQKKFGVIITPIDVPSVDDVIQHRMAHMQERVYTQTEADQSMCQPLYELVYNLSEDQARHALYHLLYRRYIAPVYKERIPAISAEEVAAQLETCEIALSIGLHHDISRDQVKSHILQQTGISRRDMKKVRVIQRKSFIEVPKQLGHHVEQKLHKSQLAGIPVRARCIDT